MWVRRHELLRLAERVKKLETQVDGLWTTVITMDKRFNAFLKEAGWSDNGDLTQVFATRQSIPEQPERGTGSWLLETPP